MQMFDRKEIAWSTETDSSLKTKKKEREELCRKQNQKVEPVRQLIKSIFKND